MVNDLSSRKSAQGGVGTIWWPEIDGLFDEPGLIDVAEIEPTTFWRRLSDGGYRWPSVVLARLMQLAQTKILHSTGFPIGDRPRGLAPYGTALVEWISTLKAPWTSEHLSVLEDEEGRSFGFLMPVLQTDKWATLAASHIAQRQAMLGGPFLFETGVNYFGPRPDEMRDGIFFAEVACRANCGILLDLHNIWANARNGRQPVESLLADLPLERVCELHVAGGISHRGYWLDAHDGSVPDPVIAIARDLVPHLPNLGAIIFEINPSTLGRFGMQALAREIERLRAIWELRSNRNWTAQPTPHPLISSYPERGDHLRVLADGLKQARVRQQENGRETSSDPAFVLYAELIRAGRLGILTELMPKAIETLLRSHGVDPAERLLDTYLEAVPPQLFGIEEARRFVNWLRLQGATIEDTIIGEVSLLSESSGDERRFGNGNLSPISSWEG